MSIKIFVPVLVVFVVLFVACSKKEKNRLFDRKFLDPIKKSRKELFYDLSMNNIPGGSIAVSVDGKLVWSEAFGFASKELEVPASRDTKYRIGNISQIISALTYQIMVEKGDLQPDSSVQHYLPDFPKKQKTITLRNLVNHSSGIREETGEELNMNGIGLTITQGLEKFKNDSLLFDPGFYQYPSVYNFNLLGCVIEKVTNKRFINIVRELVTDTLGLKSIVPDDPFLIINGRSDFYRLNFVAQVIPELTKDFRYKLPAYGFLSTADDLVGLGNIFLYSEYLSDSIKSKTFIPDQLKSGVPSILANGWSVINTNSGQTIYYCTSKSSGSGSAILMVLPNEKIVMAIATNLSDYTQELPVYKIAMNFKNFIYPPEKGISEEKK